MNVSEVQLQDMIDRAIAQAMERAAVRPMRTVNAQTGHDRQPSPAIVIGRLLEKVLGPMPIVAGQGLPPRDGHAARPLVADDPELLSKTKHVRRGNEKLLELISRTGISPSQIRSWTRDEIANFCKVASERDDAVRAPLATPMPQRFAL